MRSARSIRIAKTGYIAVSSLYCLMGIFLIIKPDLPVTSVGIMAGIAMVMLGSVKLLGYFSKDLYQLAFQHDLAIGILLAALGILILVKPDHRSQSLCIIIGIAALADGLLKAQTSLDARRFGLGSWFIILLVAFVACVIGILLTFGSEGNTSVFTVLTGIAIFAQGVLNLLTGILTVKIINKGKHTFIGGVTEENKK